MENKFLKYGLISIASLLLFISSSFGQREPVYISPMPGDSISVGKKLIVKDSAFYDPILKPKIKNTYQVNNLITLKINEEGIKVMPDSFQLSIKLKVVYIAQDSLTDSVSEK